jgi:hypothetical protein
MENDDAIRQSVHWILGHPDIFLNSAGDVDLLPAIFKAASDLEPKPSDETMVKLNQQEGTTSIFGI